MYLEESPTGMCVWWGVPRILPRAGSGPARRPRKPVVRARIQKGKYAVGHLPLYICIVVVYRCRLLKMRRPLDWRVWLAQPSFSTLSSGSCCLLFNSVISNFDEAVAWLLDYSSSSSPGASFAASFSLSSRLLFHRVLVEYCVYIAL